jgi:hypothetical protein
MTTMLEGAPSQPEGALVEREDDLLRRALWLPAIVDGKQRHEFYGYVAMPGTIASVTCVYDDPEDIDWATEVWRSVRHHPRRNPANKQADQHLGAQELPRLVSVRRGAGPSRWAARIRRIVPVPTRYPRPTSSRVG